MGISLCDITLHPRPEFQAGTARSREAFDTRLAGRTSGAGHACGYRLTDLARPPDRDMPDLRDDEIVIGEHLGVELDHRVPFVPVIGRDVRVKRQVIVKPRRTEVLDAAADVNPRPELYVLQQREIGEAQDLARMNQLCPRV